MDGYHRAQESVGSSDFSLIGTHNWASLAKTSRISCCAGRSPNLLRGAMGRTSKKWNDGWALTLASSRRLHQYDEMDGLPERPTIMFLGRHYESAMDQKSGPFGLSPDFALLGLARTLLGRMPAPEASDILRELTQTRSGLMPPTWRILLSKPIHQRRSHRPG